MSSYVRMYRRILISQVPGRVEKKFTTKKNIKEIEREECTKEETNKQSNKKNPISQYAPRYQ